MRVYIRILVCVENPEIFETHTVPRVTEYLAATNNNTVINDADIGEK